MKYLPTLFVFVFFFSTSFAQEAETPKAAESENTAPKEEKKIKAKSKGPKAKVPYRFMANVHGGIGLMNYFGDLRDNPGTTVHRVGSHAGYNFGIGANVTNYLEVNINAMLSKVSWNQNPNLHETPQNFQAESFSIHANLVYNFKNLLFNPIGITPFISIGAGYADFDVYSDLQTSKNGSVYEYNYWSNGQIFNVPEQDAISDDLVELSRDFEYETRLSEFPIATYTIPVGAGFDFNANRSVALRLGAWYYFTGTDMMDNVGGGDIPVISNDGFLYTSMSLFIKFDPLKKKAPKIDGDIDQYADLGEIIDEDSDGDGVTDLADKCGATAKGLVVDDEGCPIDTDKDGIPDYRDKEPKSTVGRIVDADGVAISYEDIYKQYGLDTGSLKRREVDLDWLFSQKSNDSEYTVHVGTYANYDIPTQLKMKLANMEGLVEKKINDTLSVFTVGKFDSFEEAEEKQRELLKEGIDEAFGVKSEAATSVGKELEKVKKPEIIDNRKATLLVETDQQQLKYGVELKEYRLRIQLDKLSKLIAQHGVEMKVTEGGLKIYTIGAFKTLAEAEALQRQVEQLGVRNPSISAKFNNQPITLEEAQKKEAELQEAE